MADITVLAWNIRTFGAFDKLRMGPFSKPWINGTLAAIACVVTSYKADILVIQEFHKNGADYLPRLQTFLNAKGGTWSFDYLPGSFPTFSAPADITGPDKLGYNSEGYAVLWNNNILAPFTAPKMSKGQNGDTSKSGYINLILTGSSPAYDFAKTPVIFPDGKGYANPAGFPLARSSAVVNSSAEPKVNDDILQFGTVRRPCWIQVNSPQYATPVPVIVYHAPVAPLSAAYGSLACGLIAQCGADKTTNVVVAGDFNLTTATQFSTMSTVYSGLGLNKGTGNSTKTGEFGFARTQTQYKQPFVNPAQLVAEDKTYEHPRDVLFYRNTIKNPMSGVIDVVADLTVDKSFAQAMFADTNVKASVLGALAATNDNYQLPAVVSGSADLLGKIKAPFAGTSKTFATALAATVFYRCFVSDHLPVSFTITNS